MMQNAICVVVVYNIRIYSRDDSEGQRVPGVLVTAVLSNTPTTRMSARLRESKATTAKHAQLLREMLKRPENKLCVDCKRNGARGRRPGSIYDAAIEADTFNDMT